MSYLPPQPQAAPAPAPQPQAAPLQFEPLYPQGTLGQDPAAQGFDQFAGAGQPQQPQASPELIDSLIQSLRTQGVVPQAQNQPGAMQPPTIGPPPAPPQIDPMLLNEQVMVERLRNLELTYGNAYQQTQDPNTRQSILLAYHGERAQIEAQVQTAKAEQMRYEAQVSQHRQAAMTEPIWRMMAAQVLARELGVQDVNRILNDPQGNPIWNPEIMRLNAMYQAQAGTMNNIAQSAGRAIAPIPTGAQATPNFASFTRTASREDFLRAVDQAKRTGIRVSMNG